MFLAPFAPVLALAATVAHFGTGQAPRHPAQLLPVLLGPVLAVLLAWLSQPSLSDTFVRRTLRVVGALTVFIGGTGTGFHLRALAKLAQPLHGHVATHVWGPAAFATLGALVWVLGSSRFAQSDSTHEAESLEHHAA
ncbi:MAG: hypothetical protein ACT4TC_23750 [Myxococcaceae bacterium]